MSSLSLSTFGVGGDVAQLATVGVLDALPPLPISVVFPFPSPEAADCLPFNPRGQVSDSGFSLPGPCTLAEGLVGVVDDAHQLAADMGLRPYQVWSVVVRWSGGERHRGTPTVVSERAFLPIPKVEGIGSVARDLRAGGTVKRGSIRLVGLSARYTQEDLDDLLPRKLARGEEHYIETRLDGREGNATRQRYVMSGTPERRAFDWTVRLEKQDENRDRSGRPH